MSQKGLVKAPKALSTVTLGNEGDDLVTNVSGYT